MIGRPAQKCITSEIHCRKKLGERLMGQNRRANLLLHVVKGVWGVDSKAYEDDVRIRVAQRAKTIIIFLASGIPQGQFDVLAVNFNIGNVVLKDGGDINLNLTIRIMQFRRRESRDLGECSL
jgi:hypothetical protein